MTSWKCKTLPIALEIRNSQGLLIALVRGYSEVPAEWRNGEFQIRRLRPHELIVHREPIAEGEP